MITNAGAWSCTKGDICIARNLFLACRAETLRIKPLRFRKVLRLMMHNVGTDEYYCAFGNGVSVYLEITRRLSARKWDRRTDAYRLFVDLQTVGETFQIGILGSTSLKHLIDFLLDLLID